MTVARLAAVHPDAAVVGKPAAPFGHGGCPDRVLDHRGKLARADREELRSMVADRTADSPRGHPAADAAGLVEHQHPPPRRREGSRCREPGDSAADDHGIPTLGRRSHVHRLFLDHHVAAPAGGNSIRIGSVRSGIRLDASTSPAVQPAIMPTVSAIDRTRE